MSTCWSWSVGTADRVERWLNRPGEEAELDLVLTPPFGSSCGARLAWAHPLRQAPVVLEVTLDGEILALGDGGHAVTFPCPAEADAAHALVASAVFADGRRVEAVALTGGFGGQTDVALTAVSLVSESEPAPACEAGATGWPVTADRIEPGSFQVVIVLDPKAGYQTLYTSGWHAGNLPTLEVTAKASEEIFRQGHEDSEPKPKNSWLKAKRTLHEADLLWYVAPDEDLHRVNGMSAAARGGWTCCSSLAWPRCRDPIGSPMRWRPPGWWREPDRTGGRWCSCWATTSPSATTRC